MGNHINKIHTQDSIYITCLDDMEKGKCKNVYHSKECLKCNIQINYNCPEKTLFFNNYCLFCENVNIDQKAFNEKHKYLNTHTKPSNYVSFV